MYTLALNNYFLQDVQGKYDRKQKIKDHIGFDDYFGTLATILDLKRQNSVYKLKELQRLEKKMETSFKNLRDDLMFLQENYKIIEKRKSKKEIGI